jgi:2-hydroxy-3-keto-5-methylthiopentenyl-1-phosphate phosphatase
MELIELIPALLDIMKSPNGQAYVFVILYTGMGFYIYKMMTQLNNAKKTMTEFREHTDEQFKEVRNELNDMKKLLYKMAGKLEVES